MRFSHWLIVTLTVVSMVVYGSQVRSNQSDDELDRKKEEIEELQRKLSETQGQRQTLASTVAYLNNRITLTQAQIAQTQTQLKILQEEILALGIKINTLDNSLEDMTELMINRINNSYKRSRINPGYSIIASDSLSTMVAKYKYMQLTARNDKEIIYQMETARAEFNNQKELKEEKQLELDQMKVQLESQQATLAKQQQEKQVLLDLTRNDEQRFQRELAQRRAELDAIQSIIAGKGQESEVGEVEEGATIAQVIPGPSTCSTGAHLHFEIANSGSHRNPASYLAPKSVVWNNSPDGQFDFTGSWTWPLNDTVRITQGYGMTYYAATLRYYGGAPHTGIDMVNNSDYTVKAVKKGILYRGSISCRNAPLRYVRVDHGEGLSSYYLHVNY